MEKVFARVRLYLEISLAVARTSQSPFPLSVTDNQTIRSISETYLFEGLCKNEIIHTKNFYN